MTLVFEHRTVNATCLVRELSPHAVVLYCGAHLDRQEYVHGRVLQVPDDEVDPVTCRDCQKMLQNCKDAYLRAAGRKRPV